MALAQNIAPARSYLHGLHPLPECERRLLLKCKSSKKAYVAGIDGVKPFNKTVISLFSGAGGLDIGLEIAGFETLACIEMDADCRATLRHNRPHWNLFEGDGDYAGDIRLVSGEKLLAAIGKSRGEVGLVVGGPPCQPFSNLGKRQGMDDPSNGDLYSHYVRMVRECLPEGFIFENVEGLAQSKHSDVREFLLDELTSIGYKISQQVVNSADYGDPQVRKRFVILGVRTRNEAALPMPAFFENIAKATQFYSSLDVAPPDNVNLWRTVNDALSQLTKERLARADNRTMGVSPVVKERMQMIRQGENFKVLPMSLRPNCWSSGKHQGQDTFGRLRADRPSVTIRTCAYNSAKGRYIHPTEDRGLSTAEMAEIQSFPQSWCFQCVAKRPSLVAIGRQIGNAVPVKLATALGQTMRYLLTN